MPVMSGNVVYDKLAIKPPVTLRMQLLKSTLVGAKGHVGATRDTRTIDNVRWGLEVHVCKEGEPDCTTTYHALSVVFSSDRSNNRWLVWIYIESYYVTPPALFIHEAFRFGQETDVTIDVTFRDSAIVVTLNGREILNTDTLKKFEQIRVLRSANYFYDLQGTAVPNVADQYLVYNLQVVQATTFDASALLNAIIPIAVALAVIGIVISLFRTGILRIPIPKPVA
jgi:hypothetical protein